MSHTVPRHSHPPHVSMVGVVSVIMSLLALLSVGWLAFLTFGPFGADPSNVVRALGAAFLPIGLAVGIPAGIAALRYRDVNRVTGVVGLLLAALTIAVFVVLITSVAY